MRVETREKRQMGGMQDPVRPRGWSGSALTLGRGRASLALPLLIYIVIVPWTYAQTSDCLREVPVASFTFSSTDDAGNRDPTWQSTSGWTPNATDTSPWLRMDAGRESRIVGVATLGQQGSGPTWVASFTVSYESVSQSQVNILDSSSRATFQGNTNESTPVYNMFLTPVIARYIKVWPNISQAGGMRVALLIESDSCSAAGGSCVSSSVLVAPVCGCGGGDAKTVTSLTASDASEAASPSFAFSIGDAGMTFAAWVQANTTEKRGVRPIFVCYDKASVGFALNLDHSGDALALSAFLSDGTREYKLESPTGKDAYAGGWIHVGFSILPSTDELDAITQGLTASHLKAGVKLYRDGNVVKEQKSTDTTGFGLPKDLDKNSLTCTISPNSSTLPALSFGGFSGKVQSAYTWNAELTEVEFLNTRKTGLPHESSTVIARAMPLGSGQESSTCADTDECSFGLDNCSSTLSPSVCADRVGGWNCTCGVGYEGPNCDDKDECSNPSVCRAGFSCVNTFGSYTCSCGKTAYTASMNNTENLTTVGSSKVAGGVTVSGWFYLDMVTDTHLPLLNCRDAATGVDLFTFTLNNESVGVTVGADVNYNRAASLRGGAGVWQHVAFVWNSTGTFRYASDKTFADGEQVGGINFSTVAQKLLSCTIGRLGTSKDGTADSAQGKVKRLAVWGRALSDDEVLAVRQDFLVQKTSGFNKNLMAVYVGEACTAQSLCTMGADRCSNGTTCVDSSDAANADGYVCNCLRGHVRPNNSPYLCVDYDECSQNRDICHKDAVCTNVKGGFNCKCKSGYFGNGTACTLMKSSSSSGCPASKRDQVTDCVGNADGTKFFEIMAGSEKTYSQWKAVCEQETGRKFATIESEKELRLVYFDAIKNLDKDVYIGLKCPTSQCENQRYEWDDPSVDSSYRGPVTNLKHKEDQCVIVEKGKDEPSEIVWKEFSCTDRTYGLCSTTVGSPDGGVNVNTTTECTLSSSELTCQVCKGVSNCVNYSHLCASTTDPQYSCKCIEGTTFCQDNNECDTLEMKSRCDIDQSDGYDKAFCYNSVGSFGCSCRRGWTGTGLAGTCVDIQECTTNTKEHKNNCHSGATCTNTNGSFTCACNAGWTNLKQGTECKDINECASSTSPCLSANAGGNCTNYAGSFTCSCIAGYQGDGLNSTGLSVMGCVDVDECVKREDNNCMYGKATCTNIVGSFTCACNAGWTNSKQGTECKDINECASSPSPCLSAIAGGNCTNNAGSFTCGCIAGYQGDGNKSTQAVGCVDVDECGSYPYKCPNLFPDCNNTVGSFSCSNESLGTCKTGFWLVDTISYECRDLDECSNSTRYPCTSNSKCNNTVGSYECPCNVGYANSSGNVCTNIDECLLPSSCGTNATCTDSAGSFACTCNQIGYSTLKDSKNCPDDDECATANQNNCHANADCANTPGSFKCACKTGYSGSGVECANIVECGNATKHTCANPQFCKDTPGSFECICNVGYQVQGAACPDVDECSTRAHNCNNLANCKNTDGSFTCACISGYQGTGINCTNIDECAARDGYNHTCWYPHALCVDLPGNFSCGCKAGFTAVSNGTQIVCRDIDECQAPPFSSQAVAFCSALALNCSNTYGSYTCGCDAGYIFNGTGCADIDECAGQELNTCATPDNGGNCSNTRGNYTCGCSEGYWGNGRTCRLVITRPIASPQTCSTIGGTTVFINMPYGVVTGDGVVGVRFNTSWQGAAAISTSGTSVSAVCPASAKAGRAVGQVYLIAGGTILGDFALTYVVPPPKITPTQIPLSGGAVKLVVYQAVAAGCLVTLGAQAVLSPVTSDLSGGAQGTAAITFTAPSRATEGITQISLSCLGLQSVFLKYVHPPKVTSVEMQGLCETLSPCSFLVTLSYPPPSIMSAKDLSMSTTGPALVPPGGTARVEVMSGGNTVLLRVTTPAYLTAGTINATLAPATLPEGFTLAQATAYFSATVLPAPVFVTGISPAFGTVSGGSVVLVTVSGLVPGTTTAPRIHFGGQPGTNASVTVSDSSATIVKVSTPAWPDPGSVAVSVLDGADINATFFAYSSAGVTAECVVPGGCEAGEQGGAGVRLKLTGFSAAAASKTVLVGELAKPATVVSMSGGVATVTLPSALSVQVNSALRVGSMTPVFVAVTEGAKTAYAQVWYRSPPKVTTCSFNPEGSRLWLDFDQPTDQTGSSINCNSLIVANSSTSLGVGATCSWDSASRLAVIMGSGATVVVGEMMAVKGNIIKSLSGVTLAAPQSYVYVSSPGFPAAPSIIVVGPTDVGTCDDIAISAEGPSSRPMSYSYTCPLDATLSARLASYTTASISFPASYLPVSDQPYEIAVTATSFLGGVSAVSLLTVTKRSLPPPMVSILRPVGPMLRTNENQLTASTKFSACLEVKAPVTFSWTVKPPSSSFGDAISILNSSSSALIIPAGSLQAQVSYQVDLVAVQTGGGRTKIVTSLMLDDSPLIARIAGGSSRTVSTSKSLTLDASESLDPDACPPPQEGEPQAACADSSLVFAWTCTHTTTKDVCRSKETSMSLKLPATSQATVELSTIALPADALLTISCSISKGFRLSTASVDLITTPGDALDLLVSVIKQTSARVALRAGGGGSSGYTWRLTGAGLPEAQVVTTAPWNNKDIAPAGWDKSTFSLQILEGLQANALEPGGKYILTLTSANAAGAVGSTTYDLIVGTPPSGGQCAASPATGYALQTSFVVSCTTWSADEYPLSYAFAMVKNDASVSWSPPSFKSSASFLVTRSNYTAHARVLDYGGLYVDTIGGKIEVLEPKLAPGGTVEGTVLSAANDLEGLGQSAALLAASSSIADGLYADTCVAEGTCGGARRKLLASSAAYRMRVRRMLLSKMSGGSTSQAIGTKSAQAVLASAQSLSSNPIEIGSAGASSTTSLLDLSASNMLSDQLRAGGLAGTLRLCDTSVSISERMSTAEAKDRILIQVAKSVQTVCMVLVRSMTSDEPAFNASYPQIGVFVKRLALTDTSVFLPGFFGNSLGVEVSRLNARRAAQNEGPGFFSFFLDAHWDLNPEAISRAQILGFNMAYGGAIAPPIPEALLLHPMQTCSSQLPRCVNITMRMPAPSNASISDFDIMSGSYVTCLKWVPAITTMPGHWDRTGQNCSLSNVRIETGKYVYVTCMCSASGFFSAEMLKPSEIRTTGFDYTVTLERYSATEMIGILSGLTLYFCMFVVGVMTFLNYRTKALFPSFSGKVKDQERSLGLLDHRYLLNREMQWRTECALKNPETVGRDVILTADCGSVDMHSFKTGLIASGDQVGSQREMGDIVSEDAVERWKKHLQVCRNAFWAALAEEKKMLNQDLPADLSPASPPIPATNGNRRLSWLAAGSIRSSEHSTAPHRKPELQRRASTSKMRVSQSSFVRHSSSSLLHSSPTTDTSYKVSKHSSKLIGWNYDKLRKQKSVLTHLDISLQGTEDEEGMKRWGIVDSRFLPSQEGLWWEEDRWPAETFALNPMHWFGYHDGECDDPETQQPPHPPISNEEKDDKKPRAQPELDPPQAASKTYTQPSYPISMPQSYSIARSGSGKELYFVNDERIGLKTSRTVHIFDDYSDDNNQQEDKKQQENNIQADSITQPRYSLPSVPAPIPLQRDSPPFPPTPAPHPAANPLKNSSSNGSMERHDDDDEHVAGYIYNPFSPAPPQPSVTHLPHRSHTKQPVRRDIPYMAERLPAPSAPMPQSLPPNPSSEHTSRTAVSTVSPSEYVIQSTKSLRRPPVGGGVRGPEAGSAPLDTSGHIIGGVHLPRRDNYAIKVLKTRDPSASTYSAVPQITGIPKVSQLASLSATVPAALREPSADVPSWMILARSSPDEQGQSQFRPMLEKDMAARADAMTTGLQSARRSSERVEEGQIPGQHMLKKTLNTHI